MYFASGGPKSSPPSRHDQRLAEVVGELGPEPVRLAGERDVVGRLVGQADDARRTVRRPAVVADGPCFEHGDPPSVAREVIGSREAHQAAADDDDVHDGG